MLNSENENSVTLSNNEIEKPFGFWKLILFIVVHLVITTVLIAIIAMAFMITNRISESDLLDYPYYSTSFLLLMDAVSFLLTLSIFKSVRHFLRGAFSFEPLKKRVTHIYLMFAIIALFVSQYMITDVLGLEDGSDQIEIFGLNTMSTSWLNIALVYLSLCVVTPVKEEILFRGIIYRFFEKRFNFWIGIIIASIVFGSLHEGHVISAAVMGAIFVMLYKLTNSLMVSILLHIVWNVFAIYNLFSMI